MFKWYCCSSLALLACEICSGDEVILPNFNGPYALFAVGYVGAKPVLVDVDDNWIFL